MKPGVNIRSESDKNQMSNQAGSIPRQQDRHSPEVYRKNDRQTSRETFNGARAKEKDSYKNTRNFPADELHETHNKNTSQSKDEIDQLLDKLNGEHRFNDWETVKRKFRHIFEEDRLKANNLNGNSDSHERSFQIDEEIVRDHDLNRNRNTESVNSGQSNASAIVPNGGRVSAQLGPNSAENSVRSQDQYANLEAYTEYMASNRDPDLVAKWGERGERARSHSNTETQQKDTEQTREHERAGAAAANESDNRKTKRNKNMCGSKTAASQNKVDTVEVESTGSTGETNEQKLSEADDSKVDDTTEKEKEEEDPHQEELKKWLEGAKEWGRENGFPEPTPSDEQDSEQNMLSMLGGMGRRRAGPGNSFLGGQGPGLSPHQLAGGSLPEMFNMPAQGPGLGQVGQANEGAGFGGAGLRGLTTPSQNQHAAAGLGRGMPMFQSPQGGHMAQREEEIDVTNIDPNSPEYIQQIIAYESFKAANNRSPKSPGMCTVIIIETSSSMVGDPMIEAGKFLVEFINGVQANKSQYQLQENIGVITVGTQTEVLQHLTTDYERIRTLMDSLQFEGPNPLFLGVALIHAVLQGHQNNGIATINNHNIRPRIILISSGFLSGRAEGQWQPQNDTQQTLCAELVQSIAETSMAQMFSVHVGTANKEFLDSIASMTGGKLMTTEDAKHMSRSYLHHRAAGSLRGSRGTDLSDRSSIESVLKNEIHDCTGADVDSVIEIVRQGEPDIQGRNSRVQQMMEAARQQQTQQGRASEVQRMEQLQQLLGAMQGQGDQGVIDLLAQLQQEGAPGGGNLEELLRSMQSMQGGGGAVPQGGLASFGLGSGPGRGGGGLTSSLQGPAGHQPLPQQLSGTGMPGQLGGSMGMPRQFQTGTGMPGQLSSSMGMPRQIQPGMGMPRQMGRGMSMGLMDLMGQGMGMPSPQRFSMGTPGQFGSSMGIPSQLGRGRGMSSGQLGQSGGTGPSVQQGGIGRPQNQ